jgi:eukaryotic translation initiation factor 2C
MKWLREKTTMVVGADVTHPSPLSAEGTPSVASVVASVDKDFVQYPASLSIQQPDQNKEAKEVRFICSRDISNLILMDFGQMIEDMKEMMIERLQLYKKKNKALPQRVIFYRDGVSEGQFDLVLQHELPKVQAAFDAVYGPKDTKPTLSIIICGKRYVLFAIVVGIGC